MARTLALLVLAISAFACARLTLPDPVTSEHLQTKYAGFVFDRGTAKARYHTEFIVTKPFTKEVQLVVDFENPLGDPPFFTVSRMLSPSERLIDVESPSLPAIQNNRIYRVVAHGSDIESGVELFRHSQEVLFYLPPDSIKR